MHRLPRRAAAVASSYSKVSGAAVVDATPLVELKAASLRPFLRSGAADPDDPMGSQFGPVLTSIDWAIRRGEHWAIVGQNGAGYAFF